MSRPSPLEIRWLGHATVVITIDGVRFVTDPALNARLVHLRRHHVVEPSEVRADVVLISHVHMDHLHLPSLRRLGQQLEVVVPTGAVALLRRWGPLSVREVRVGDRFRIATVEIEVVPAVHSSRRGPHRRLAAPPVGYVLRGSERTVYFAGDTDLFEEMAAIGSVDVALLPIAGWGATLGSGHLDPERATTATGLLLPDVVVPIHWGTYSPIGVRTGPPSWLRAPAEDFAARMAKQGHADRLHLLEPGGLLTADPAR